MLLTSSSSPLSRSRSFSVPTLLLVPSLVLATAYVWTVLHRPPVPRHLQLDDRLFSPLAPLSPPSASASAADSASASVFDHALALLNVSADAASAADPSTFGWPSWYGPGDTPYDVPYSPAGEICEDKARVIFYIDLPYDSPHMLTALATLSALESAPDVDVVSISRFAPAWDPSLSVAEHMEMLGCGDRLWRVSDHVGPRLGCPNATVISEIYGSAQSDPRADVTVISQPHDMVSHRLSHAALKAAHGEGWEMGLFAHVLPSADPTIFYPRKKTPDLKRVTYFPRPDTRADQYPKLQRSSWSIYYSSSTPRSLAAGQDHLAPTSAYRRYWQNEATKRAQAMRSASVCVFEQWHQGLLDDDMVQAMLAGCVVAAVVPEVERELLSTVLIPLPKSADADSWMDALETALAGDMTSSEIQRRALHAFIIARQKFTADIRVKAVRDVVNKWHSGARGYLFPNGWRWSCDSPGDRPPWCHE